jgi:hypothetical protein
MFSTVGRFIYTQYWGILYVQHWEDLFTQNTEEYCTSYSIPQYFVEINLPTVFNVQYSSVFCVNKSSHSVQHTVYSSVFCVNKSSHSAQHTNSECWSQWEDILTQNTGEYFMFSTVGRFIYTKYWGILYVEHCGQFYLHKILRNIVCWTPWEYLFTQNLNITSSVFCVNKYSHSVQHKVFPSILCK